MDQRPAFPDPPQGLPRVADSLFAHFVLQHGHGFNDLPGLSSGGGPDVPLGPPIGRSLHWYELLYTGNECRSWLVYILCLLAALRPAQIEEFCQRLNVPPRIRLILVDQRRDMLVVNRRLTQSFKREKTPKNSMLCRWFKPLSIESLLFLMAFSTTEGSRQAISRYVTHLQGIKTSLNGKSLQRMGLKTGPHFAKILDALLTARLDGLACGEQDEIALVKKRFSRYLKD